MYRHEQNYSSITPSTLVYSIENLPVPLVDILSYVEPHRFHRGILPSDTSYPDVLVRERRAFLVPSTSITQPDHDLSEPWTSYYSLDEVLQSSAIRQFDSHVISKQDGKDEQEWAAGTLNTRHASGHQLNATALEYTPKKTMATSYSHFEVTDLDYAESRVGEGLGFQHHEWTTTNGRDSMDQQSPRSVSCSDILEHDNYYNIQPLTSHPTGLNNSTQSLTNHSELDAWPRPLSPSSVRNASNSTNNLGTDHQSAAGMSDIRRYQHTQSSQFAIKQYDGTGEGISENFPPINLMSDRSEHKPSEYPVKSHQHVFESSLDCERNLLGNLNLQSMDICSRKRPRFLRSSQSLSIAEIRPRSVAMRSVTCPAFGQYGCDNHSLKGSMSSGVSSLLNFYDSSKSGSRQVSQSTPGATIYLQPSGHIRSLTDNTSSDEDHICDQYFKDVYHSAIVAHSQGGIERLPTNTSATNPFEDPCETYETISNAFIAMPSRRLRDTDGPSANGFVDGVVFYPSPLRPRSRPLEGYSLFPEVKPRIGAAIPRLYRSFSSIARRHNTLSNEQYSRRYPHSTAPLPPQPADVRRPRLIRKRNSGSGQSKTFSDETDGTSHKKWSSKVVAYGSVLQAMILCGISKRSQEDTQVSSTTAPKTLPLPAATSADGLPDRHGRFQGTNVAKVGSHGPKPSINKISEKMAVTARPTLLDVGRRVAIWMPTGCFCQPAENDDHLNDWHGPRIPEARRVGSDMRWSVE